MTTQGLVTSEEARKAGFLANVFEQAPTMYYIQEVGGALELYVV